MCFFSSLLWTVDRNLEFQGVLSQQNTLYSVLRQFPTCSLVTRRAKTEPHSQGAQITPEPHPGEMELCDLASNRKKRNLRLN